MIREDFYKDRPAVTVSTDEFSATFLPLDGAKLVSYKNKNGEELMAQMPGEKYLRLGIDSNYIDCECSACDDMFPTIDPCEINGQKYLDHGEVCRIEHNYAIEGDKVTFSVEAKEVNSTFAKTVYTDGKSLFVKYRIENHNDFTLPYIWAAHMMLIGEEGAYVESEFSRNDEKRVMFGKPLSIDTAEVLEPFGTNKGYKFYYTDAKAPIKCSVIYPDTNKKISVEFDNDIVKYLGVWMNPGDLNDMYNIAIEPCTALYDDPINAEKGNAASYIAAKGTIEFTLKIDSEIMGGK